MQNLFFLLVKKPLRPRLFVSYFDLNVPLLYNSFSTYNRVQRDRSLNEDGHFNITYQELSGWKRMY